MAKNTFFKTFDPVFFLKLEPILYFRLRIRIIREKTY